MQNAWRFLYDLFLQLSFSFKVSPNLGGLFWGLGFCLVWFWGYNQQHSGLTPGRAFRSHSWWGLETIWNARLASSKVSALSAVLSHQLPYSNFFFPGRQHSFPFQNFFFNKGLLVQVHVLSSELNTYLSLLAFLTSEKSELLLNS